MSKNITTPTATTSKRKMRFYSKEELKELAPFIKQGQKPNEESLKEFCKKYNRPYLAVLATIYNKRRAKNKVKNLVKRDSTKASLNPIAKNKTKVNLSKGEFHIPIKSWSITQHTDGFYFNVKF